jgi:hypothetical protein
MCCYVYVDRYISVCVGLFFVVGFLIGSGMQKKKVLVNDVKTWWKSQQLLADTKNMAR